jgi:hypothetical protein
MGMLRPGIKLPVGVITKRVRAYPLRSAFKSFAQHGKTQFFMIIIGVVPGMGPAGPGRDMNTNQPTILLLMS